MSAISFAVHKKSGGEIKVALVPDDQSGTVRVAFKVVIFASLAGLVAIVIWFTIHN